MRKARAKETENWTIIFGIMFGTRCRTMFLRSGDPSARADSTKPSARSARAMRRSSPGGFSRPAASRSEFAAAMLEAAIAPGNPMMNETQPLRNAARPP